MARDGELVLRLAADAPLGAVSAACSPIDRPVRGSALRGISGTIWPGRSPRERLEPRRRALVAPLSVQQHAAQVVVDRDRRVARGVDARRRCRSRSGRGRSCWRRGSRSPGPCRRPAGRRRPGCRGRERAAEHRLAGEVEVAAVLEHGAGRRPRRAARPASPKRATRPSSVGGEHVLVGGAGVRAVRAGEGDAVAADRRRRVRLSGTGAIRGLTVLLDGVTHR